MSQLVLKNILAGSGNVLAGGDNSGNVNKVTIGSNLTLSGGVLSAVGGGSGSVTSVAVTRSGDALSITGSPITSAGTINIGFAGTGAQYIKGDGTLATFPTTISQAQKLITEVYNETGATLTKGTVVYINGGHGNLPTVTKAIATGDATSAQTYGVVQSDITNNNNGFVVVIGSLIDTDTQAYPAGTQLYLSSTTAGAYTSVKQYAPAHLVYVGIVVRSHPTQGVIEIRIQNGFELDELHNVSAQSPSNGNILQYNSTTSLWTAVAGTTTNIAEGTNLYFTNARAIGATLTGYVSGAGTISSTDSILTAIQKLNGNVSGLVTGVSSVFGRTGAVVAASGDYTTTQVTEGTNLYFTNARARGAMSANVGSALTYDSTTGRYTLLAADSGTDGYLTAADWTDFDSKQASLGTGTTSQFLRGDLTWATPPAPALDDLTDVTITSPTNGQLLRYQLGSWINFTPTYVSAGFFSATTPLAYNSTTGVFSISQANTTTSGYLSSTDFNTFNNKQAAGNYITDLTGEATASGPGSVAITLTNSAVIGKVLTGLNVTGGSVAATDSILTAFGKVQNQINGLIGGSIYKGTWNASTNTPALTSSVGTAGWYYIVSVAGTTNLNGITDWQLGDWAIFNGGVWQKVDNTDSVISVNGFTGAVSLTTDNISEGATNLYYTNTRARGALSANPGSALTYNSSTGRFTLNAADGTTEGYVTAADYNYWDAKQASLGTGTTSQWLRGDLTWSTVPAPALDDLTDVTITTPSNGQLLRYQAGTWINFTPTYIVAGYLSATAPLSYNSGTGVFSISQATTSTNGYLSSTDFNTFNGKQNAITLTTTGTSGAATLVGSTLNIPQYQAVLTNPITGTGTTNYLPKFTGTSTIGNSIFTEDGGNTLRIIAASAAVRLDGSNDYLLQTVDADGRFRIYDQTAAVERLTISSVGNVGIGSISPSGKLEVNVGSSAAYFTRVAGDNGTTNPALQIGTSTSSPRLYAYGLGMEFFTAAVGGTGTLKMILNSSGNLGLGVTPSAWRTTDKVIQINNGSIYDESGINFWVGQNYYENSAGSYIYLANSGASAYRQYNGQHQWFNAASGTAGTAISFTQAMTLFANGNLAVGTTTDAGYKLDVNGTGRFASALTVTNGNIQFGTSENVLQWTSGNGVIEWGSSSSLYIRPTGAGANSLIIASTGAVTFSNDVSIVKTGNALLRVQASTTTTPIADIELMRGTNSTWGADAYGDYRLRNSGGDLTIQYGDTGVTSTRFTIASTGAATFSSSVTANNAIFNGVSTINLKVQNGATANTSVLIQSFGSEALGENASIFFKSAANSTDTNYAKGLVSFVNNGTGYGRGSLIFAVNNSASGTQVSASDAKLTIESTGAATFSSSVSTGSDLYVNGNSVIGNSNAGTSSAGTTRLTLQNTTLTNSRGIGFYANDGTQNPRSWIKHITASGSQYMEFSSDYSTGSSTSNWVFLNGNVGIGTSSPARHLSIYSTIPVLQLVNPTTGITSSDGLLIYQNGVDASIENQESGPLIFLTSAGEKMRITATGNIGIGTTSPASKLDVAGGIVTTNGAGTTYNQFANSGNDVIWENRQNGAIIIRSNSSTERMRIASGGNVLIGTTTDAGYKLDVNNGNVRIQGQILGTSVANNWLQSTQSGTSAQFQTWYASNGTTRRGYFGYGSGGSDNFTLMNEANGQLVIGTNSISALTIASTGAATFSSSVTATGFFESSDKRLKKEISDNPTINIEGIKPKLYIKDGKEELGYYAQDLQSILPSSVTEGKDGFLSLSYTQVHTAKIASLEKEVAELKELIKTLIK